MKYLFFTFLVFSSFLSFGQGRSIDVEVVLIDPQPHYQFVSRSNKTVTAALINLGPDTLYLGDKYSVQFKFGGTYIFPSFETLLDTVYPGDSIFHSKTLDIYYRGDYDSFPFCVIASVYNTSLDSIKLETKSQKVNNTHCVTVSHYDSLSKTLSAPTTNIETLRLYPNPADNQINVVSGKAFDQLVLYNAQGSVIKQIHLNAKTSQYLIPLDDVITGIYFLRIEGDNTTYSIEKFIVQ